jgi:hypothetical protein
MLLVALLGLAASGAVQAQPAPPARGLAKWCAAGSRVNTTLACAVQTSCEVRDRLPSSPVLNSLAGRRNAAGNIRYSRLEALHPL